jgi:glycosyltransferase involved in cell wall biosynthesis
MNSNKLSEIRNNDPVVSIITSVYNGEKYLEDTIKSVINQSYTNIEYIIIDGGSTDGSINIIKKYQDKITYWVSEKDRNMYDGINKGLKIASGDIVASLNSDDFYADNDVVSDIVKFIDNNNCDGIYGNVIRYYQDSIKQIEKELFQIDFKILLFSEHSTFMPQPTLFIKRDIYKKLNYFDLNFNYASDFDFNLRCIKNYNIKYFNRAITFFRQHEESITSSGKLDTERETILIDHGINSYNKIIKFVYYYYFWMKYKVKNIFND